MRRVKTSAAFLLLFCAVIQGCGPQDEPNTDFDYEVRGDTEVAAIEEQLSASPNESTPNDMIIGGEETLRTDTAAVHPASETLLATYESDTYVEGFVINYRSFFCPGCVSSIRVEHWSRDCRLCSYKKVAERTLLPGESWSSCYDGRRTKAKVYGQYSDRSFYDWSFNFWNCS
jgi:hypothetical protein